MTSTGMQVHGGVGFIEETGACQYYRDSRITTIYEGTTGIQANDLIGRKLARKKKPGASMQALLAEMMQTAKDLECEPRLSDLVEKLNGGIASLAAASDWILSHYDEQPQAAAAGAVPFLKLTGIVAGGWLMARSAAIALKCIVDGSTDDFYQAKLATANYFAAHQLPFATAYAEEVTSGSASVFSLPEKLF